jgi:L-iditol 2-dehydrogenase
MKAVAKTSPEPGLEVIDAERPEIRPGEVLLQVAACGICGSDLHLYEWDEVGKYRRGKLIDLPRIIGHEPSGIVAEVGEGVTNVKRGDRVASDSWGGCGQCYYCRLGKANLCEPRYNIGALRDGAMAEYVLVPWFNLYPLPDNISLEVGAMIEPLGVAVHAVERCATLKPGDRVVVLGPGSIGILIAMVVRAGGGDVTIAGLAKDAARLELAASLGFDSVVLDGPEGASKIMERTRGRGADIVFDAASAFPATIPLVRKGGEVVITGTPGRKVTADLLEAQWKELTLTFNIGRIPSSWHRSINLLESKALDIEPLISHRFGLDEFDTAFDLLRRSAGVKILLEPSPELIRRDEAR